MSDMEQSGLGVVEGIIKNAILIAGPTASGKSAFALDLARRHNGIVINADSMQVYSVLRVLTARPSSEESSRTPHALYGHVLPSVAYSTGAWLRDVAQLARSGEIADRIPIFVGGTGLYFRALSEGISAMPDIPQSVRDRWRRELAQQGSEKLHQILLREDPATAMRIRETDGQRILRALEVLEVSGRSILDWQGERGKSLIDRASAAFYVLQLERRLLIQRIEQRFDAMIDAGALDEVKALSAMRLDPALPAVKAIGVRELQAAMDGEMTFPQAIERAKIATRQYSKRQSTWFRHQLGPEWQRLEGHADGG